MSERPPPPTESRHSGVLPSLSASEAANLDERGIPKKLGRQARKAVISGYDKDTHTVTMAVSSETPVNRYYGEEVLSHEKGAIRTDRLKAGVALLFNHDMDLHLGRSQSFELGDPMHVTSRFGTNPLALEKEGDVDSGILVDVSIGYIVHQWDITEDAKTGARTYTAVDWELLEVSLVTVPADPTVGVGRSAEEIPVSVRSYRTIEGDPASLRTAASSGEDDEEEDPDDEENEGSGSEDERTTNPTEQRNATMAAAATPNPTPTPAAAAGTDLVAQQHERVASLRAIRKMNPDQYSEESLYTDMTSGRAISVITNEVADRFIASKSGSEVKTGSSDVLGRMSEREQKEYSLRNVYCAAINQRMPNTYKDKGAEAGFEREVSDSLKTSAGERGFNDFGAGIVVPTHLPYSVQRAQQQRTIAAGGPVGAVSILPTVESTPIELLRSRTVCLALGARYMPGMFGNPRILRQNSAAQSNWLTEGQPSTSSDIGFDYIQMAPKRLSIQNGYFLEFLAQSPLAIEDQLRDDRNAVLARSLDTAGVVGPGTNGTPLGLLGQTGLTSILTGTTRSASGAVTAGAGGVPLSYVDCNNFEAAIATANGDIGTMGWALTPRVRAALRSTPKIPGTASGFVWPDASPVDGNGLQEGPLSYRSIATANAAFTGFTANSVAGCHLGILGVWDQMLIGDWGFNEVINDNITGAPQGLFNIIEHSLHDINFRHIASFAASTSILPS